MLDLNSDGSINWQTSFGSYANCAEEIADIEFAADGGLLVSSVTGNRFSTSCPIGVRLLKLDSNGSIQWQKIYPSFGLDNFPALMSCRKSPWAAI